MLTPIEMVAEMFRRGQTRVNYRGRWIEYRNGQFYVDGGSRHGTVMRAVEYIDREFARAKSPEAKEAAKKAMMEKLERDYPRQTR